MTELRACPYCGGEAKVDPYSTDAANCVNAFSGAENATCRNDAILTVDEWNTRPVEDAQAASIAKNDAEIERLGLYGAKMFAEVERLRVAIDEIIDLDFPDLGAGWEYKTWEDMTIELKDIARAAREKREVDNG